MQPLPGGKLPADQTIEGGGQIRVTRAGFAKISGFVSGVINDLLGQGICLPRGEVLEFDSFPFTGALYCDTTDNQCAPGCDIDVHMDSVTITAPDSDTMNLRAQFDVDADIHARFRALGIPSECTMRLVGNDIGVDANIGFNIDPATGELGIQLQGVNNLNLSGLQFSNCGLVSLAFNALRAVIDSFLGDWIIGLLRGTINDLIQGFLPRPLGIANRLDIGALLSGIAPGIEASIEARMVPGGYVQLSQGGLSVGLITGINADRDINTRAAELDSEPAFCVPPMPAPDLAAAPSSLQRVPTPRGSDRPFELRPAEEFLGGQFEPATDLAIGISETTLDLGGHHAIASGALCVGVGTSLVAQLNVGILTILVPSLGDLVSRDGKEPVLLVLRPQKAIDFEIGEGTEASPSLTLHIQNMEADFYAFIFERYTRIFTMSLDLDVGVNLEFQQAPGQPASVKPILVGLSSDNIRVEVLNKEFVRESVDEIKGVLPSVFDVVLALLPGLLNMPIQVPDFAGFTLSDLRMAHVTTTEDDFLAIYASLGASAQLQAMAGSGPAASAFMASLDAQAPTPDVVETRATLVDVEVPSPEVVRKGLAGAAGGALPSVTIDVAPRDAQGRELEWSWNLDDGIWRNFTSTTPLVISDRAFAWQGKYSVGLRSRVKGDYRTTDPDGVRFPVIIDSVAPRIWLKDGSVAGGKLTVPASDAVSPAASLQYAFGSPGDTEPATDWQKDAAVDLSVVRDLAVAGQIEVFAKDEAGNVGHATAPTEFHGQAGGDGGCSCDSSGRPSAGGVALLLLTVALFFRRRVALIARAALRSRAVAMVGLWMATSLALSVLPGCGCGSDAGGDPMMPPDNTCEMASDCASSCQAGEVPLCFDNECLCSKDIPYGRIGPHSDVDVASTGEAWVSAYAQSHGDLAVAKHAADGPIENAEWEFVDGVPDGPVVVPGSAVRGGVAESGDDVGMYTSIKVGPGDAPMVTYFDRGNGELKFAGKFGGVWQIHVIDEGTGSIDPELGGEVAGLYSSLTLRSDDGRPGVVYMALASSGGGVVTAEVRYAAAQTATPTQASDWQTWVVDTVALPPVDPAKPDVVPLANGVGLFADSARDAQQAPVVVYYDRLRGDLKLARFNAQTGQFDAPEVLDGASGDVGWYPSVAVDGAGVAHVVYQSATRDDVLYINTDTRRAQIVDDGFRTVGQTEDGLPKPEFHMVGSDSNVVLTNGGPMVVYQDSTSHELVIAKQNAQGMWTHSTIAGGEEVFSGAYGFYASAVFAGEDVVISNWVIDQPDQTQWVEIHREKVMVE